MWVCVWGWVELHVGSTCLGGIICVGMGWNHMCGYVFVEGGIACGYVFGGIGEESHVWVCVWGCVDVCSGERG